MDADRVQLMPSGFDCPMVMETARRAFASGRTLDKNFVRQQLKALLLMYTAHQEDFIEAIYQTTRKPRTEAIMHEINFLIHDLNETLYRLNNWSKPKQLYRKVLMPWDKALVQRDPFGVVLIIGTWNYPVLLSMLPFAGALAAGNCIILKPSEVAPKVSNLLARLIPQYLDQECYQVVEGGPDETSTILQQRFDYIFFTGSVRVGRIVHAAANRYLTPVTLELGGKCPVYIDESADLPVTLRRILSHKLINFGQICVAPDYLICSKRVQQQIITLVPGILEDLYGTSLKQSPDIARVVNDNHFQRLMKLLSATRGRVALTVGEEADAKDRWLPFTIIVDVQSDDALMQDEIFGPILPIVNVHSPDEAINYIRQKEKPLCIYVFTSKKEIAAEFQKRTFSGQFCINDIMTQFMVDDLPFGGVGNSGMGCYMGKHTYRNFTHGKSVVIRDLGFLGEALVSVRYPKYEDWKLRVTKTLFNYRWLMDTSWIGPFMIFCLKAALFFILGFFARYAQEKFFPDLI